VKGRNRFVDGGVNFKIILKQALEKGHVGLGPVFDFCGSGSEPSAFVKAGGISLLAYRILVYRNGLRYFGIRTKWCCILRRTKRGPNQAVCLYVTEFLAPVVIDVRSSSELPDIGVVHFPIIPSPDVWIHTSLRQSAPHLVRKLARRAEPCHQLQLNT